MVLVLDEMVLVLVFDERVPSTSTAGAEYEYEKPSFPRWQASGFSNSSTSKSLSEGIELYSSFTLRITKTSIF